MRSARTIPSPEPARQPFRADLCRHPEGLWSTAYRRDRVVPWRRLHASREITRFGGPEVLEIVDVPEPTPGQGQRLCDVSTADHADTRHR